MRFFRLSKIVLGVTAACVAAGGVAGILCGIVLSLFFLPKTQLLDPRPYAVFAIVGAGCGLLLGPVAAFGFLRRVPLGRLFLETALGAAFGGMLGFAIIHGMMVGFFGATVGFVIAVAHLAAHYRVKGGDPHTP